GLARRVRSNASGICPEGVKRRRVGPPVIADSTEEFHLSARGARRSAQRIGIALALPLESAASLRNDPLHVPVSGDQLRTKVPPVVRRVPCSRKRSAISRP